MRIEKYPLQNKKKDKKTWEEMNLDEDFGLHGSAGTPEDEREEREEKEEAEEEGEEIVSTRERMLAI